MNNKHKIILSDHGYERLIERTQCKRNQVLSYITNVWENGKSLESYDKKSSIFNYLVNAVGKKNNAVRVKGNTLFIFNKPGTVLITCFDIPQRVIQDKGAKREKIHFFK